MRIVASAVLAVLLIGAAAPGQDGSPDVQVSGRVLGPDGCPSPGARVSWSWSFPGGAPTSDDAVVADQRGVFCGKLAVYGDPFCLFAYSKDDRFAGFVEGRRGATCGVVIRLCPAVRVTAGVVSDAETNKPIAFSSTWDLCHRNGAIRVAKAWSKDGALAVLLPPGAYDCVVYDEDYGSKTTRVTVPRDRATVDLGAIVIPPSFLARHLGKQLPEWEVAAARGVDSGKTRIADFRGKWLFVEFWGFW